MYKSGSMTIKPPIPAYLNIMESVGQSLMTSFATGSDKSTRQMENANLEARLCREK